MKIEDENVAVVIQKCAELRDLLLDCSRSCLQLDTDHGEWDRAQLLFDFSKEVDSLRRRLSALEHKGSGAIEVSNRGPEISDKRHSDSETGRKRSQELEPVEDSPRSRAPLKRKLDYPQYLIRGDSIVKRGLARDRRSEYEHIVPRRDFEQIFSNVKRLAQRGDEFGADDVQSKLESPVYRTYIVLAILRKIDFLEQSRRGVYVIGSSKELLSENLNVWTTVCNELER